MSAYIRFKSILRLFCTLFPFLIVLIQGINGRPPVHQQQPFDREESFERESDPACAEIPDSGSGQQLLHVWHFSLETAQCRELLFRGRGGGANMFPNRRECERRCLRHYTEGAEQVGPKLKATVEHLFDKSNSRKNVFSHRSVQTDYEFRQKKGKNSKRRKLFKDDLDVDYTVGGYIAKDKPAPHPRSLTAYDDQGAEAE